MNPCYLMRKCENFALNIEIFNYMLMWFLKYFYIKIEIIFCFCCLNGG